MKTSVTFDSAVPMIPAALFAILASAHIGATHAVVFGGFASASLAQRIEASKPRAIVTASCGIEGTKGPLSYKPLVQEAIAKSSHKPGVVLVWQREQLRWDSLSESNGEKDWKGLVTHAKARGLRASAEPVKSDDGLYIIYTSGKLYTVPLRRLSPRVPARSNSQLITRVALIVNRI